MKPRDTHLPRHYIVRVKMTLESFLLVLYRLDATSQYYLGVGSWPETDNFVKHYMDKKNL